MKSIPCAITITVAIALILSSASGFSKGTTGAAPSGAPSASSAAAPSATSTTPSSTTALETQILAFQGIDATAQQIAENVCRHLGKNSTVVIYDQTTFASLQAFAAFQQNARAIENAYYTLQGISIPTLHTAATVTESTSVSLSFSPVSDFTSLLSALAVSSNTETYGSITIPDSALAIAVSHHLSQSCGTVKTIAYPPLFGQGSAGSDAADDIQGIILQLNQARKAAHDSAAAAIKNVVNTTYPAAGLADIDALYDNLMNSLINVNATTGIVGSVSVVQGQELASLLGDNNTYVLLATVLTAAGTVHDHKTFWTNLWNGDIFTFSGGSVVGAALWQPSKNATPAYSDLISFRTDLTPAPVDRPPQVLSTDPPAK